MPWSYGRGHHDRRPRRNPLDDDLDRYLDEQLIFQRKKAEYLLEGLNAWAKELPRLAALYRDEYYAANDTRQFGDAMRKFGELLKDLNAIDADLRDDGLAAAPRTDFRRKGLY